MAATTAKSQKAKGRSLQKWVRARLIDRLGLDPEDVLSTPMGVAGCDLYLSPAAQKRFPFGVECKNTERLAIWEDLAQAETNAAEVGLTPLLVFKRARSETYVTMRWSDFEELIRSGSADRTTDPVAEPVPEPV
jgi:hypothetical protein